jgi:hypothetical protein
LGDKIKGDWRKLHDKELITCAVRQKARRKKRNRKTRRWEDNINMSL